MLRFFVVSIIILALTLDSFGPLKIARAQYPVEDLVVEFNTGVIAVKTGVNVGITGSIAGTTAATLSEKIAEWASRLLRWVKEDMMRSIRDIVAKRILDYIVDQTVQWVQGGGQPKFVTDWKGFLQDAADIAFDSIVRDIGLARICQPFALNLRVALTPIPIFSTQVQCTLDKVVQNLQNFYTDFNQGGWIGYTESFYPANNFFGAWIMTKDEQTRRQIAEAQAKTNEAQAGGGFLNVKKCIQPRMVQRCVNQDEISGECVNYQEVQEGCDKYETQTPGAIVGKAVGESITSDTQWAANIQSWTAALINAAINRLTKEGLLALQTGIRNTFASKPSYDPLAGTPYANSVASALEQDRAQAIAEPQRYLDTFQKILDAKRKSSAFVVQTSATLVKMQGLICVEPAAQSEINAVNSEITRLQGEVTALNASTTELQGVVSAMQAADNEIDLYAAIASSTPVVDRYRAYFTTQTKTQTIDGQQIQIPVTSADLTNDAKTELAAKTSQFNAVYLRYAACTAPTATSTTATSTP